MDGVEPVGAGGAVQTVVLGDRALGCVVAGNARGNQCSRSRGLLLDSTQGSEQRVALVVGDVMSHVGPVLIALGLLRFNGALLGRLLGAMMLGLGARREQNPPFQIGHFGICGPEARLQLEIF